MRRLGFTIEKRFSTSRWTDISAVLSAVILALILTAALIALSGANPLNSLQALYRGAFGSRDAILETLVQATPLIFTGLAIVIAFRGRVWNIGAEGQFFAGAMAAAWLCMSFPSLPGVALLTLSVLAAAAGGALWGLIPGFLKAKFGASEIIVTVMMNYIILLVLSYLLSGPWREPTVYYLQTPRFPAASYFSTFFNSRVHLGLVIALLLSVVVYFFLWRTPLGYEIRAMGDNPVAARYKGIATGKTIILAMCISGAIAGLGGASEVLGVHHRLRLDISIGYGFLGILIALLGRLNPFGVVLAAVLFGALVNGSTAMQVFTGVPSALVQITQAIVLIFLLVTEVAARYRVRGTTDAS